MSDQAEMRQAWSLFTHPRAETRFKTVLPLDTGHVAEHCRSNRDGLMTTFPSRWPDPLRTSTSSVIQVVPQLEKRRFGNMQRCEDFRPANVSIAQPRDPHGGSYNS